MDLNSLFKDRTFLQYLLAAGADIGSGRPIGENVNAVTQQNISAKSQADLTKHYIKAIGGILGSGGKLSIDKDKFSVSGPSELLKGGGEAKPTEPFSVSQSELAGLGPQDISRALSGAIGVEQLRQQSMVNMLNMLNYFYGPEDRPFPVEVPGVGKVTLRQWRQLPQEEREYALFTHESKKLGSSDIMSRREFRMLDPTDREKFIRQAMKDPKLMEATKELAKAGATKITIGEKVAESKAMAGVKNQLYFSGPKWLDDVDKYINSEDVQRRMFTKAEESGEDVDLVRAREIVKYIENKITAGTHGGKIQDVRLSDDGRVMIWTVKWPSGDVEEIKYAIRS